MYKQITNHKKKMRIKSTTESEEEKNNVNLRKFSSSASITKFDWAELYVFHVVWCRFFFFIHVFSRSFHSFCDFGGLCTVLILLHIFMYINSRQSYCLLCMWYLRFSPYYVIIYRINIFQITPTRFKDEKMMQSKSKNGEKTNGKENKTEKYHKK